MDSLLIFIIVILAITVATASAIYFTARYFFRFTILRKPPATLKKNINANTDWSKHLDFIGKRKEWLSRQSLEKISIKSNDGLKLNANFLKAENPTKKLVICFHGYTSNGVTNFGSMAKFYHDKNVNLLMPDARAHGESEGKYIGFGVLDRMDALKWIEYAIDRFGDNCEIYLHGVSMGGATVLMTSGLELPNNVKGIISDCAFTSAYDVFKHILKRDYHLPEFPLMNITDRMTRKYAGYGYSDVNTIHEVAKTNIPILFIHGDKDDFVPTYMTEQNYKACNSPKTKLIVKDADHAEAYYKNRVDYEKSICKLLNI